ncbi:MAG TPA: hypothetical protein VGF97_11510 [Rhizomicrobium sp.]
MHPSFYEPRDAIRAAGFSIHPKLASETVLVAGGSDDWRHGVSRQIAELGCRMFEAESSSAALQLLDDARIDLLLTDTAPVEDRGGITLARTARERYPTLKILLTAGLPDFRLGAFADLQCSVAFFSRPCRKEDLAAALHEAIED